MEGLVHGSLLLMPVSLCRSDYGKLIYMLQVLETQLDFCFSRCALDVTSSSKLVLQDSQDTQVQSMLEFKCVRPLRTVAALLEEKRGVAMLSDPLMSVATAEIIAGDRPRAQAGALVSDSCCGCMLLESHVLAC